MTPTTVHQVLRKAHAVIRGAGWVQGRFAKHSDWRHSPVCLFGSLCVAVDHDPRFPLDASDSAIRLIGQASDAIQAVLKRDGWDRSLSTWNDVAGRTRDDVLTLLDAAIREAAP